MSVDYKSTVFLPKTDFPMKARLPDREPELLARWRETGLYQRMRAAAKGREKFILHDGPPYANGHLHIGHALNKILKDMVNRSQQMLGRGVVFVPGWDCHGLPIEWKIEEKYRAEGKDKDSVPLLRFRQECREFAAHWVEVQGEEFQRLGVLGDWDAPYTTMDRDAEACIVAELGKFLMNGGLYKGAKPVLWSVVERTALAEAEVEYDDHTSTTIWVRFPVAKPSVPELEGAAIAIWTTTPWTIPGNRAAAFGADIDYAVIEVEGVAEESRAKVGERLVLAEALLEDVAAEAGIAGYRVAGRLKGRQLSGTICRHPFHGKGYDFDVPALEGDFVTTEQGTGFVHIAPGHGQEDFVLGRRHGIQVPETVGPDGAFVAHVPLFAGKRILTPEGKPGDADMAVVAALEEAGALLAKGKLTHSYPHSWRSKAPLIFRTTAQWFISMDTNDLRAKALAAIDDTRWVPPQGRNRIYAMVETRPDWCVSRQRAWGVPITVFVDAETGEPLRDARVLARVVEAVAQEGSDAWFSSPPERFLAPEYDAADFEAVADILDVWFESGCTHAFVLEAHPELAWPASLYLEGSDQHRGWFHSSLLESCGTRGRAPYQAVLTHGFVLDELGRKMSKSLGNVVSPQDVAKELGADILRLWVAASDYSEDLRIGPDILKHQTDVYRRLRNTLRYLLGNLSGFGAAERVPLAQMPEFERWVLHRLHELDRSMRRSLADFDFHAFFTALHAFCAVDLSAFYFDVRKDSLYCDRLDAPRRRAVRTVLHEVFDCLTAWLAPVLSFTAEEAWLARNGEEADSVHLRLYPESPPEWRDDALAAKWEEVRELRRVVTGALEIERAEKRIGSSLQAHPTVYAMPGYAAAFEGLDLAEITITSDAILKEVASPSEFPDGAFRLAEVPGVAVVPALAEGGKCVRCWRVLPEVGEAPGAEPICGRCAEAVDCVLAAAQS
ncbi:MAG: isoleucine--tRNA ligase [Alphaproteobacteria bacterium]